MQIRERGANTYIHTHKKEGCSRQQNELQPHRTAQTTRAYAIAYHSRKARKIQLQKGLEAMNDRIKRAKEEYRKRFFNRSDNTGAFFTSDFYEVKELSEKIGGGGIAISFMKQSAQH